MDTGFRDGVMFSIAVLGAALGIVNLWRDMSRERIRVRVIPKKYNHSQGFSGLAVDVVNRSNYALTVSQIGFALPKKENLVSLAMRLADGGRLPVRLEPRASITAYFPAGTEQDPGFREVRCAYARTACGRVFTGKSPALRQAVDAARTSAQ